MGIASKYNKGARFTFQTDTSNFVFRSLEELYKEGADKRFVRVRGMYINRKGNFGDSPVVLHDRFFVNLPQHLTGTVQEMLQDDDLIAAINAGCVGFKVYKYQDSKFHKDCYSVEWVDVAPPKEEQAQTAPPPNVSEWGEVLDT